MFGMLCQLLLTVTPTASQVVFEVDNSGYLTTNATDQELENVKLLWINSPGKIKKIDSEKLEKLKNLEELCIRNCPNLKVFSEWIWKLTDLKILSLQSNDLTKLSKKIGNMKGLRELYISNNKLKKLPIEICTLTNLTNLYVDNNKLEKLPDEIGNLVNLEFFSLNNNKLKTLPKEIGNLRKLISFSVFKNRISEIPDSIDSLEKLKVLNLNQNRLTKIPRITNACLKQLNLGNNLLKRIPKSVTESALKKLVLQGNKLAAHSTEDSLGINRLKEACSKKKIELIL